MMTTSRYENLVELGEASCRRFVERPLFGTKLNGTWSWIRYGEFQARVDEFRAGLSSLGVREGDRVAIVANNRVEWAVAAYATYGLGASFVPLYEVQPASDWRFILGDCGAKVVLGSNEKIVRSLEAMREKLPALEHVIGIERALDAPDSFQSLLERGRKSPVPSRRPSPDSVAGFVYTSGTTGKPKGVLLTHENLTSNIAATMGVFPIYPEDRSLSFLPWAHAYGQVAELHMLLSVGASTALNDDLANLATNLTEVRPTLLVAVPRIFTRIYQAVNAQMAQKPALVRKLLASGIEKASKQSRGEALGPVDRFVLRLADRLIFAKVRAKFGGRLKYAISASAALSEDVARFVDALGIAVYEGYGLTETSPVVSANCPGARKLGSVGKAIPGVKVDIDFSASPDPGRGEIIVRGPNVMKGYYNRDDENAQVLLADGGLRTGDLGYVDADGYLYITGRIKEQYKLENGKYVIPTPLEEKLKLSPYISNVMLYGDNRPFNVALVVIDSAAVESWAKSEGLSLGADVCADPRVNELLKDEIDQRSLTFRKFEQPRAFVLTLQDFTPENGLLTPTLKIKRRAVLEKYGAALAALYREEVSDVNAHTGHAMA